MSLVTLKNIFFPSARPKSGINERDQLLPPKHVSRTNSYGSDVESQTSTITPSHSPERGREKSQSCQSWKIDARVISDATIGLSDGLTVPFALTAGLSALGNTRVVIYGGFAELIAGAISMGLGGYLGAKSEEASYLAQREEVLEEIETDRAQVLDDVRDVFDKYNIPDSTLDNLTTHLGSSSHLCDFVMQFQHGLEEPAASRAFTSAITIAMAYFIGGLLPLIPYFFVSTVYAGLKLSVVVMVFALFTFGYVKTCAVSGWRGARKIREACFGGVQMVIVGSVAAGAAMGLVRLFNEGGSI